MMQQPPSLPRQLHSSPQTHMHFLLMVLCSVPSLKLWGLTLVIWELEHLTQNPLTWRGVTSIWSILAMEWILIRVKHQLLYTYCILYTYCVYYILIVYCSIQ